MAVLIGTLLLGCCIALPAAATVLQAPGWPTTVECDLGESFALDYDDAGTMRSATVELLAIRHQHQPDYYSDLNDGSRRAIARAEADLLVDGEAYTIVLRPYQSPQRCGPLQIYLETTKRWATTGQDAIGRVRHDLRLSACAAGASWGPAGLRFPIEHYRWHANTYQNTWMSMVPQGKDVYYHKGEDWGCVPDRHPVIASLAGTVVRSPLPDGDGRSNTLTIESADGIRINYTHMNSEQIDPGLTVGASVVAGQRLGLTGATWSGKPNQSNPHLHYKYSCAYDGGWTELSTYPYAMAAYLRDYDDPAVAIAGGYVFGVAGEAVTLDGSRSRLRNDRTVARWRWYHSDGSHEDGMVVEPVFQEPGTYSLILELLLDDGTRICDALVVRIYDGDGGDQNGFSAWLSHVPLREVDPGDEILCTLAKWSMPRTRVDWGDGSPTEGASSTMRHRYDSRGWQRLWLRSDDGRYSLAMPILIGDFADTVVGSPPRITAGPLADPSPVTNESSVLSVTVEDDGPAAELVYAWQVDGPQPASIAPAGSASPTLTFSAAGRYTVSLTVTDGDGLSASAALAVEVEQTPRDLRVAP